MHDRRLAAGLGLATVVGILTLTLVAVPAWAGVAFKSTMQHPDDPFVHQEYNQGPSWIKFLILVSEPDTVYFQDSNLYPFHYDFATSELTPFAGMTRPAFDTATLYETGQQAVLGAVLIPPTAAGQHVIPEYGIQLVRRDAYPAIAARDILLTVTSKILSAPEVGSFYMPTLEQQAAAESTPAIFEDAGFPLSSPARWNDSSGCYSDGWALGTLKFFTASQIDSAYLGGQLSSEDILLTNGVPAEIPFLAGVISLAPSTPNSHVALLAKTFNVPFAHVAADALQQKALSLVDQGIALRVRSGYEGCQVRIVSTEGEIDQPTMDGLLELKTPPPLNIAVTEFRGAYSSSTDGLTPADIRFFGGKAANTGILRQSIPTASPVSTAFSFDLWNEFLDQQLTGGITLRQEIAERLGPYGYPPDLLGLDGTLRVIGDLIKDDTVFSASLAAAVLASLQDSQYGFDPNAKLRFRSSTNVEDSDRFTGAGLYDSFSGCLADDLDGDGAGPSRCDPAEPNEKGVFRAIRRVFASFYNLNATLERLRHGINEDDVGMALLVHHSFPDPIELANGVASYTIRNSLHDLTLVLQPGANSVTNPDPEQIPEEIDVYVSTSGNHWPTVLQQSNLLLLGETVLDFPGEYVALTTLLKTAAEHYRTITGVGDVVLEYEFKKTSPGDQLVVTQVRQVPQPDTTPSITPFLLNEPTSYCSFQGEGGGTVLAIHRLKSRWDLETESLWLTQANLDTGFFADVSLEFHEGCKLLSQEGPLPDWPGFAHTYMIPEARDAWTFADLQRPASYTLVTTQVSELVSPAIGPLTLLTDFGYSADYSGEGCLNVQVDYADTVPEIGETGPSVSESDFGLICRCPVEQTSDILVQATLVDQGVTIETSYTWPKPAEVAAGYTAHLKRFVQTTITGLISQPIVLTGDVSQTYKPGHHNASAEYVFEPALEPGLSQAILDELAAIDVRVVYASDSAGGAITLFGDAEWGYHCLQCRGRDSDGDGRCEYEPTHDCDDANPGAWSDPGEVPSIAFQNDTVLNWTVPAVPGANAVTYDTLSSLSGADFSAATCEETSGTDTTSAILEEPLPGSTLFILVRARNDCPSGIGTLGIGSNGNPREGTTCP